MIYNKKINQTLMFGILQADGTVLAEDGKIESVGVMSFDGEGNPEIMIDSKDIDGESYYGGGGLVLSEPIFELKYSPDEIVQSLQKYPKYIVMESEDTCDVKRGNCDCSEMDTDCQVHSIKLKLITNSEGKQQGIIKEVIYES